MKNICDIVQDILPLYVDEVCSDSSRTFVEEHLEECEKCLETLKSLRKNAFEDNLIDEKENILGRHFKAAKRKTFTVGVITAGVLMIPVIVCLIVNLATGHALNWFFIVLTSLLVTASLTVVPLVVESKKLLWTSGTFLGSLMLLLATCCIYTGGKWFFIAAISVLLGASTVILPIIAKKYFPEHSFWKRNKGLLVFTTDTILLYSLIFSVAIFIKTTNFLFKALSITTVCVVSAWLFFLIVRYWRVNGLMRTGGALIFFGMFLSSINTIINSILEGSVLEIGYNFSVAFKDDWINLELSVICIAVGIIFLFIGLIVKPKNKNKSN